jgi:ADP-heptose:LPS heptosyltransferase
MLADLPRPIHIINMFALDPARRWPIDSAIALIATLARSTGGSFLLNAGPDASDYHDAAMQKWRDIARKTNGVRQSQLADCLKLQPSMEKDVALYHQADIYIGVDSFTANLALNCNLPAVILFAHERDVLRYRDRVWPIVAPESGIIGTIAHDNIMTGVGRITQKWAKQHKARALDYAPE